MWKVARWFVQVIIPKGIYNNRENLFLLLKIIVKTDYILPGYNLFFLYIQGYSGRKNQ